MSTWVVIPSLLKLRDEFNLVSPHRDKGADGTIGDSSHTSSSDHTPDEDSSKLRNKDADHTNEVHALDIDSTGPWPDGKRGDIKGSWFDKKIHEIIATEKKRWEDPKDMCRLNYIIWCGVIYDKDNDWIGVPYHGTSDPHTGHVHFSARYETRAESDVRSWGVYVPPPPKDDDFMGFIDNQDELNAAMNKWAATPAGGQALLSSLVKAKYGSQVYPNRTLLNFLLDLHGERDFLTGGSTEADPKYSKVTPDKRLAEMATVPDEVADLKKLIVCLIAKIEGIALSLEGQQG